MIVCVPWQTDDGPRARLWAHCRAWWEQRGATVYEGAHEGQRTVGCNAAALAAGDWDVAIFADADIVLGDVGQAERAAALAVRNGKLVFAHDHWWGLTEPATEIVLAGTEGPSTAMSDWDGPNTYSSCLAVPRRLWDALGGFDERFVDWGYDDLAFWSACCAIAGYERVRGPVFHLFHPRSWETNEGNPHHSANQVLGNRYLEAKGDAFAMMALLAEPGGPLS